MSWAEAFTIMLLLCVGGSLIVWLLIYVVDRRFGDARAVAFRSATRTLVLAFVLMIAVSTLSSVVYWLLAG